MKSNLIAIEPNLHRSLAIADVLYGVDITYNQSWIADKVSWLIYGEFTWNIDKALGRLKVNISNEERWMAPEYADTECLNDKEESAYLYRCIDKALLTRLFSLKRIERKLAGVAG